MLRGGGVRGEDEANEAEQEEEEIDEVVEKEVEEEVEAANRKKNIYLKETYGNFSLICCSLRSKADLITT